MEENKKKNTAAEMDVKNGQPLKTPKRAAEISQEALEERQLLEGLLLERTQRQVEDAQELLRKRFEEEIELRSGIKISLKQVQNLVTAARQPYEAKFPNDVPFFSEMYRLLGWTDKDPKDFNKPAIVGKYLRELIYFRFHADVLPTLQTLAMPGGIRLHKFFQFLNEEGQEKLIQYRDEAIALMKTCSSWYEFRVKYGRTYGLPVQKKMFEKYNDENGSGGK